MEDIRNDSLTWAAVKETTRRI